MIKYFLHVSKAKLILWCYLIWYCVTLYFYFDSSISIWLNSIGISIVIGIALMLSVSGPSGQMIDHWQTFRLFMMPFCVSSFSSLIKGREFIFIIPPKFSEQLASVGACLLFLIVVYVTKRIAKSVIP